MNSVKQLIVLGCMGLAFVFQTSCESALDQEPLYGLNSAEVYSKPENYKHVLAKIYSGMALSGIQGPAGNPDIKGIDEGFSAYVRVLFNLQELPTDEVVCGWNDPGIPEMNNMQWSADNSFVKAMYSRIFYQIVLCNEFIRESSDASMTAKGFSEADQMMIRQFRDEARFMRALSYSHALDLFGSVPFVTEADPVGAFLPEQISRTDLFNYLETELKDLETKLLPAGTESYGRAGVSASNLLLSRLYLNAEVYTGTSRWLEAMEYAEKVINSGAYQLDDNYQHLFLADNHTSPEIIFPVCFDGVSTQTYGGTSFIIHASVGGTMAPDSFGINGGWAGLRTTRPFIELFPDSTEDSRYSGYSDGQTLDISSLGTFTDGYGFPKFRNVTQANQAGSDLKGDFVDTDFPMFRLAEAYLIYAEAAYRSGSNVGQGLSYLNNLRERAYGNSSKNFAALTEQILLDERGRELSWECHRRTDLIRFGKFTSGDFVWPFKGGSVAGQAAASHLVLYPLPTTDIALNPNLTQNPGY